MLSDGVSSPSEFPPYFFAVMAVCNQLVSLRRRQIIIFYSSILVIWVIMCILTVPFSGIEIINHFSVFKNLLLLKYLLQI